MQVQTGAAELVLAGGADSMSQAEFYSTRPRWGVKSGAFKLEDRLERARVNAGGVNHPVPGRHARDRRERAPRVRDSAGRAGRAGAALAPARRRRPGERRVRAGDRPGGGSRLGSSSSTSTRAPTRRSRRSGGCARSWAQATPRRPSPPATAAARTTARRSASSHTPRRRPSWGCSRWHACGRGPSPAWRPRRWASGRCRRRRVALERAGLTLDEIDLIELNEAFASQVLAVLASGSFTTASSAST